MEEGKKGEIIIQCVLCQFDEKMRMVFSIECKQTVVAFNTNPCAKKGECTKFVLCSGFTPRVPSYFLKYKRCWRAETQVER